MGTKKLAIDLGNSNIKLAGEVDGELKLKLVRSLVDTNSFDTNHVVVLDNTEQKLHFGVGMSLVEVDKTNRKYINETVLLGAYEVYGASEKVMEIDLALGLPLDLYKSSKKEDFEDKLKNLTNVVIKGRVNDSPMSVKVKSVTVCSEGYSAFLSILPAISQDYKALLLDVGFGTTDAIGIMFDKNVGKWKVESYLTVDNGLYNIYDAIKDEILDKEKNKDLNTVSKVETTFLTNPIVLTATGEYDINKYLYAASPIVSSILTDVNKQFTDMYTRKIHLLGGGAEMLDKITGDTLPHKQMTNKEASIYANAIGYLLQIKG